MPAGSTGERLRLVRRLASLVVRCQRGAYFTSLRELAIEYGCSERTIRRDLEALEAVLPVKWRKNEAA